MNNFMIMSAGGVAFIVILALLTIVVFAGFVWLLCAAVRGSVKLRLKPKHLFLIMLAVGAVIRMAIAFSIRGLVGTVSAFSPDRTGYTGLVQSVGTLLTQGFDSFMNAYGTSVGYYPLTMYVLSFFGAINLLFGSISIDSAFTLVMLKLPFVISDILLAFTLYKISHKYLGENIALAVGGFVALCPAMMLGSIWPSVYSFLALALALVAYFMLERKYVLLMVSYTAALMVSFEAIYLLPVIAIFLIYAYVKKISAARNASGEDGKGNRLIYVMPLTAVACLILSYLATLPFALPAMGASPFAMLYEYCFKPFDGFGYFTYNGLSLYNIFGKNGEKLSLAFPVWLFSLLFILAIIAVTAIIYLTKKNRANLVMLSSYLLLTMNVYFVNSSETTLLPFFALTLVAFAIIKDRRMLQIIGAMSLVVFLNAACVLVKADYIAVGAQYLPELLGGKYVVMSIAASVIAVLCHIYYTVVLLDVVMNNRTKKLAPSGDGLGAAMRELIRIKD